MSASSPTDASELIRRARDGDQTALGELFDRYRDHLRVLARQKLWTPLGGRIDASDVVQKTYLEAHQAFGQFLGVNEPELLNWLRKILEHNIADTVRDHTRAKKRAVGRERSLDDSQGDGAAVRRNLAAQQSTPSQKAIRGENALALLRAMEQLSEEQRLAVRMRHFERRSLEEIAQTLGRTPAAAAGLVNRGLVALGRLMKEDEDSGASP